MAELVLEKSKIFFDLTMTLTETMGEAGFTKRDLIEELNKNRKSALFTSLYNLEDYIESNLLLKRLEKKDQKLYLTDKGKKHAKNIK